MEWKDKKRQSEGRREGAFLIPLESILPGFTAMFLHRRWSRTGLSSLFIYLFDSCSLSLSLSFCPFLLSHPHFSIGASVTLRQRCCARGPFNPLLPWSSSRSKQGPWKGEAVFRHATHISHLTPRAEGKSRETLRDHSFPVSEATVFRASVHIYLSTI